MITEPKTQPSSTAVIEREAYKSITTYVPCREVPIIGTDMSCKELLAPYENTGRYSLCHCCG